MYKLIDKQGMGTKEDREYTTLLCVLEDLRNYHSADVANTDKMTLNELLDIGDWELLDTNDIPF